MIKRIELVNFLSHEHSVIELTEGLNVLVGPNNCGKSSIVTALQVLCYNDDSKYVLRHGTKECSVEVETDDGHIVRWSRKKSGSAKYEIDGESFDRLGRNGVPDKLHEVLRLPRVESEKDVFDVHFGEQRSPVFLLNDKPRAAAEFFASSSDASRLVEMQQLHKQRVRDKNSSLRKLHEQACELELALEQLSPVDALLKKLEETEQRWEKIQQAEENVEHLRILVTGMHKANDDLNYVTSQSTAIHPLATPPELADTHTIQQTIAEQQRLLATVAATGQQMEAMQTLQPAPIIEETPPLEKLIKTVLATEQFVEQLSEAATACQPLEVPPELGDPKPLAVWIEQKKAADNMLDELDRQTELLTTLMPCPKPQDTDAVAALVTDFQKQTAAMTQLGKDRDDLRAETKAVEEEIAEWARENPECPTCGGLVSAEQLISHGGHNHGS